MWLGESSLASAPFTVGVHYHRSIVVLRRARRVDASGRSRLLDGTAGRLSDVWQRDGMHRAASLEPLWTDRSTSIDRLCGHHLGVASSGLLAAGLLANGLLAATILGDRRISLPEQLSTWRTWLADGCRRVRACRMFCLAVA